MLSKKQSRPLPILSKRPEIRVPSSLAAALKTAVFNQVLSESPAVAGFIVGPAKVRAILQPERIQYLVGAEAQPLRDMPQAQRLFSPNDCRVKFQLWAFFAALRQSLFCAAYSLRIRSIIRGAPNRRGDLSAFNNFCAALPKH